jgi:hypothetical protein
VNWSEFEAECARRRPRFWWRDDDAGAVTPELKKLLELSRRKQTPLALAVVPDAAEPELFRLLHEGVTVIQHGTDHRNRAAAGEKKTEYPAAEPIERALARISQGQGRLRTLAGKRFFPVLAPPWNRLRKDLLDKLPAIGVRGVSGYGARAGNTQVDIVAWRQGKRFIGEQPAFRLALSSEDPVGWLTHHAVHDEQAWEFLERLLELKSVRWVSVQEAFSYTAPAHG